MDTRRRLLRLTEDAGPERYLVALDATKVRRLLASKGLSNAPRDRKLRSDLRRRLHYGVRDLAIIAAVARNEPSLRDAFVQELPWILFVLWVFGAAETDLVSTGLRAEMKRLGILPDFARARQAVRQTRSSRS